VGGHKNNLRRNHIAFVGYNLGEVVATNFFRIKMGLNYRLYKNFQVEVLMNAMSTADKAKNLLHSTWELPEELIYFGYGTGATYNTILGPLSVFVSANSKERGLSWYINFGFTF
jgi:hypothetical protein